MSVLDRLHVANTSSRDNGVDLSTLGDVSSARWDWAVNPDETLWNKKFPYQLAVVRATSGNASVDLRSGSPPAKVTYSVYRELVFTLPINPESLLNSTPFAINVRALLGGVAEQHGGVPFKPIQFTGTFGVVGDRPSATTTNPTSLGVVGGIFAGTLETAQGVATTASALGVGQRFTSNLSGDAPSGADGDIAPRSTGYFQFRALQKFLETYAEMKKTAAGRDLRLALIIWKEEAAYICTPLSFDVQRSAVRPFEYAYSLRLQAWSRVNPRSITGNASSASVSFASGFGNPSALSKTLTYVSAATRVVRQVENVVKSVRRDFERVVGTLRQAALFVSAAGSLVKTASLLPSALRATLTSAVVESWDVIKGTFDGKDASLAARMSTMDAEVKAVRSGQATTSPAVRAALLDDSESDFHDLVHYDSLNLSQSTRANLDDFTSRALLMTSADFQAMAAEVLDFAASYADVVGLSDSTYDVSAGHVRAAKVRDATDDDFRNMHAMVSAATAVGALALQRPARRSTTSIEYVAGLASANGIAVRVPNSKFAVPFPYGGTLEKLALQYLGDESRWIEIAELNDLRAPYVDEVGQSQALQTNGSGHVLTVGDASGLALGQQVVVWSGSSLPELRTVESTRKISDTQWEVVVDGAADLAKLKTSDSASVRWYPVWTVNSQKVIYIPSDRPADPDVLRYVPTLDDFSRILDAGDVDGMLSESGDLVVTGDGDWPVVTGLAYLVQWARVALNTRPNSFPLFPDFGVDAGVGQSAAESSAKGILDSVRNVFRYNPTFVGLNSASVVRDGPTTKITLELGVRESDALLPITFNVAQ